jgi:preprotein translocase subunit SecG
MHTFLVITEIALAVIILIVVILQPSKTQGFGGGFITGTTDRFYSKNKSRTYEAALKRTTVVAAILFAVVTLALNLKF